MKEEATSHHSSHAQILLTVRLVETDGFMHLYYDRNHVHSGNQIQNKRASEIKSIPVSFWKNTMSRSLLRRIFAVHLPFPTPNSTAFYRLPPPPSTTITPLNSLFSSSPTPQNSFPVPSNSDGNPNGQLII